MAARCSSRRGPRAKRSHTPPPKSAPPNSAYASTTTPAIAATVSAMRMSVVKCSILCEPQEQRAQRDAQEGVQHGKPDERREHVRHRRHRVACPHHAIDDPGLTPDFGYDPASFERHEAERSRQQYRGEQQSRPSSPPLRCPVPRGNAHHKEPTADHYLECKMTHEDVGPLIARYIVEACYLRIRIVMGEEAEALGNLETKAHRALIGIRD